MESRDIEHALKRGFPLPDERRQEALLRRCLDNLDSDEDGESLDGIDLDDSTLEMLAAAGTPFAMMPESPHIGS